MTATSFSVPLPPTTLKAAGQGGALGGGALGGGALGLVLRPPLDADTKPLFEITPDDTLRYFLAWPTEWTQSGFSAWFKQHRGNAKSHVFVVELGGAVAGSTSYLDVDLANRSLEIGATWYAPALRGGVVNPACKRLLLGHAFETLGCVRVTLKCDARNIHSQRAIEKLGATREGVLRRHRIQQDGFVRDTVMFGIIREEWPRIRESLDARIAAHR